jgi:hypothetical protein
VDETAGIADFNTAKFRPPSKYVRQLQSTGSATLSELPSSTKDFNGASSFQRKLSAP